MRRYLLVLSLVVLMAGCGKKEGGSPAANDGKVVVQEVLQVTQYTYARVLVDGKEVWLAGPKSELKKGERVNFSGGMEMKNFKSKELDRTFDSIFFINSFADQPEAADMAAMAEAGTMANPHGKGGMGTSGGEGGMGTPQRPALTPQQLTIEKAAGGITVAELYANPKAFDQKSVTIRGKVVKVNEGIMDRNWLHLQDGTRHGEDFDLTVTSTESAQTDETITVRGKIALNKDFGYGYSYKILLEEARIIERSETTAPSRPAATRASSAR